MDRRWLLVLVVVVGLAACGVDGRDAADTTGSTPTTADATDGTDTSGGPTDSGPSTTLFPEASDVMDAPVPDNIPDTDEMCPPISGDEVAEITGYPIDRERPLTTSSWSYYGLEYVGRACQYGQTTFDDFTEVAAIHVMVPKGGGPFDATEFERLRDAADEHETDPGEPDGEEVDSLGDAAYRFPGDRSDTSTIIIRADDRLLRITIEPQNGGTVDADDLEALGKAAATAFG